MPLPFDFEGKGFFELLTESANKESCFFLGLIEPTSVLDTISSPSPPTSTLSSSLGGGGGSADTAGVAAVSGNSNVGVESRCGSSELRQVPPPAQEVGGGSAAAGAEKCGLGMEDWESILSDSAAASPGQEQSVLRWIMGTWRTPQWASTGCCRATEAAVLRLWISNSTAGLVVAVVLWIKVLDPHLILPPPAKRHNAGGIEPVPKGQFSDSMLQHQQQDTLSHHLHLLPYLQQRPKMVGDEMGQNQVVIDQLFKAAELIQTGNSVHAHGILARLNHQLSPIGKPFHRAAFFFKEALQVILHPTSQHSSPYNLILKIGAYKSFSEFSPLLQFANFTCNQALLEIVDGFDRIHIVDFDIGYGGQWASLMQELALRGGGAPALKITAFASPSTHDQLELGLTRENLIHFAAEINVPFEFEIVSLDSLQSLPLHGNEAVAVNLPVGSFSNHQLPLPLVLRFVKQLSPKIVVSVDRGCDRTDLPFPNHVIHALQSFTNLLESLDAVNVNLEALQKMEKFLIQPGIEKIVMGRYRNFAESQADFVVKRTPVRGFHVEKRQSSLVLCWQQKELISASAWRC
ncbi:GRAS family transcription factor [Actinidia rufa]|uniref:GRAS family transcription factor n=1 Tax=Actinidia rufa TaxID=165716 RepID=A0A7J0E3T3_9ERIC|nr:GRAS family transcription factor [Actinidia rufa]